MKIQSNTSPINLTIQPSLTAIPMGKSVTLTAQLDVSGGSPADYILLPFVNQRRWGSHERPDGSGKATFFLPLPNVGTAHIQVIAMKSDTDDWMGLSNLDLLLAGTLTPACDIRSNQVDVEVSWRNFPPRDNAGSLFCIQWETWFFGGTKRWGTAQSVPVVGFYDSCNLDVIRQHMLWFMDLGVDFILPDWSNHIWGCEHWDQRGDGVNAINHGTTLALEVMAAMRSEGIDIPKLAFFPGVSNGPPATMGALNEELSFIYHTYVRNPRFEGLFQEFEGKPLVAVLDTGAVGDKRGTAESAFRIPFFKYTLGMSEAELDAFRQAQPPVDDTHFTIRWMSSQNQTTRHHELGYWSWMDGVLDPPVTYKDGVAEAVTVTPTFFNALGWTDKAAYGRRGGATYLETFKTALKHRPKVIFLHQWNEFSGQREGHGMGEDHNIYADSFSMELSDDIEPVSLTAPGYRGDKGGWGFYDLNLTRALMELYRGQARNSTFLAVSDPLRNAVVSSDKLKVAWNVLGEPVKSFSVQIDGKPAVKNFTGCEVEISLAGLSEGQHCLSVLADGAVTYYPLARTAYDEPLAEPIPVCVEVPFVVNREG